MIGTYDVVVVGAGSAGCVLAARLSEDPGTSVLLLEAGPPDDPVEVRLPAAFYQLFGTERDWDLSTEPEPRAGRAAAVLAPRQDARRQLVDQRDDLHPRQPGRLRRLGRARLVAGPTCCRTSCGPRTTPAAPSAFHATGGPLRVEDLRRRHPLIEAFLDSAAAAGLPANPDFNGAAQDGVGPYQVTQRGGRRWSAADALPAPGAAPAEPHRAHRRAGGRVRRRAGPGHRGRVPAGRLGGRSSTARREVVLAAGAIGSPQLLMLSGIGPAAHLREHGHRGAARTCRWARTCRTTRPCR